MATAPIYLTPEQLAAGGTSLAILACSFCAIVVTFIAVVALRPRFSADPMHVKAQDKANDVEAAEAFVTNFHALARTFISPNVTGITSRPGKLISWAFVALFVVAVIITENGLRSISLDNQDARKTFQISAGLICYFVSVLGYFVSRVISYYRDQLELRKKIVEHRQSVHISTTLQRGLPLLLITKNLNLT